MYEICQKDKRNWIKRKNKKRGARNEIQESLNISKETEKNGESKEKEGKEE